MSNISSSIDCVGIAVPFFLSIASQSSLAASHETPRTCAQMKAMIVAVAETRRDNLIYALRSTWSSGSALIKYETWTIVR